MTNTFIPVAQFVEGQILTAGSLMQFPQFYAYEEYPVANLSSGTAYQTIGSIYVSGGFFGRSLLVDSFLFGLGAVNTTTATLQLRMSGIGLGGGSVIVQSPYALDNDDDLVSKRFTQIPSGAGWITASGATLFMDVQTNQILNGVRGSLGVWGRGKP